MFEFEPIRERTNIIFAHVPKCAGTSLVGHLWGTRPRVRNINYQRVEQEFAAWLASKPAGQFVYGHLRSSDLARLESSGIDYRLITFVRHPVERLRSWYRYDASPQSPIQADFVRRNPDFEAWALSRRPNMMMDFLVGEVESAAEYVKKVEARFDFVGVAEYFEPCTRHLLAQLGREYRPQPRRNVSAPAPGYDVKVGPALFAELAEKNELDVKAYQKIKQKWESKLSLLTATDA